MRFDDDERINMADPPFTRGELKKFEVHSICSAFDRVAEVLGAVNDGKEATVYLCRTHSNEQLAAKVYRARKFRAFSNTQHYVDTSKIRDRRAAKAIRQGTRTGKTLTHEMWIHREWSALKLMSDAGASVPRPVALAEFGILMEYIGDADGAAPMLIQAKMDGLTAKNAWLACLKDVETLLDCNLIHGDLSPYNVLWWQERPRLIDLPQALEYSGLGNAFELLHRDVANLAGYFQKAGVEIDPIAVVSDLADRYF